MRFVFLSARVVRVVVGMLVRRSLLLPLREVTAARIVDARVAGLLTLREVTAVILLGGMPGFFLAFRETRMLVVITMVVVLVTRMIGVIVAVARIVVGMLAHVPCGSPAIRVRPL